MGVELVGMAEEVAESEANRLVEIQWKRMW